MRWSSPFRILLEVTMSSPLEERRSPLLRLMDAFLQEENIKWVLGLGVCILLGSSLRLVTLHWVEYTPVWKYLILVAYSVTIFALGEFSYLRLGLRKTGTVLKALTVLLIPISFLALHWVQPREDDSAIQGLQHVGMLSLLGVNLLWSAIASWRIFGHFLRRPQPTFFACYLILCLAGAVVPGLPAAWSLGIVLILWAVFTVGTVKVNRHVFWLTEEHQLPRVFGFFPILLLGAQFAAVYLLGIAGNVTPAWMGLLCTLVALPVLMTADTVARVFEQRNGGLVRPIPWSISGPLALGTMLSAAGVVLALTCFPASPAIVPTSVIAAIAMGIVAQRTQKQAFVWGMLFCVAVAYQTSPVFFKELVLQLRDQAAAAVRESRLPYAFYGLTYAPLIIVFTGIATWLSRRGNRLFAGPLQTSLPVAGGGIHSSVSDLSGRSVAVPPVRCSGGFVPEPTLPDPSRHGVSGRCLRRTDVRRERVELEGFAGTVTTHLVSRSELATDSRGIPRPIRRSNVSPQRGTGAHQSHEHLPVIQLWRGDRRGRHLDCVFRPTDQHCSRRQRLVLCHDHFAPLGQSRMALVEDRFGRTHARLRHLRHLPAFES
jgi:hypothetical protein